MSDTGVNDWAAVPFGDRLKKDWWRLALTLATLTMGAFAWYEPVVATFAVVPALLWCWSRTHTGRRGTVAGVISLALTAWILLPRDLGFSGPWVPSVVDVWLLLPPITAVVHATGTGGRRCARRSWKSRRPSHACPGGYSTGSGELGGAGLRFAGA